MSAGKARKRPTGSGALAGFENAFNATAVTSLASVTPAATAPTAETSEPATVVSLEPTVVVLPDVAPLVEPEPVALEPVALEPVALEPVALEPVALEPVALEPVALEPVAPEPVAPEPVAVVEVAAPPVRVRAPKAPAPVGEEQASAASQGAGGRRKPGSNVMIPAALNHRLSAYKAKAPQKLSTRDVIVLALTTHHRDLGALLGPAVTVGDGSLFEAVTRPTAVSVDGDKVPLYYAMTAQDYKALTGLCEQHNVTRAHLITVALEAFLP